MLIGKSQYKQPSITVDAIIPKLSSILLIKRKKDPYKDTLALPGGFVEYSETAEQAIIREIFEETSLKIQVLDILGIYSDPKRDPRGHVMTIVFISKIHGGKELQGDDAKEIHWINLKEIDKIKLAFDHSLIIKDYKIWKKIRGTYWTTKDR
ncbi:MAG: NUDIX hydrolase [Nitrososphaeraceae archaeon]|nr:NUDIX hydrolase [Nitrososphaeraceae archaeon]